jgi:hypothetical protein
MTAQGIAGPFLKKAFAPAAPAMMAPADAPASPPWTVSVLTGLGLDDNTYATYQSMANILSTVTAVPNAPTAEYVAVLNGNYLVNQWFGSITQVTPDGNGGNLVNLLIGAELLNQDGSGAPTPYIDGYSEQWAVDANGNATFVQSFDPNHLAGTMPVMMVD